MIGFEQAGASSAVSEQKFYFDFYISRPLGFHENGNYNQYFGPPLRWWGDVRVASYPQQVTTAVAEFSQTFAEKVGQLKVNELADFGEFRTGLEFRLTPSAPKLVPNIGADHQRAMLGFFVGFGALGQLNSPNQSLADRVPVFLLPPAGTPQAEAFNSVFPVAQFPVLAAPGTKYVGLTTPVRDRFFRQYGAGFRLTTQFYDQNDKTLNSPAMVAVSFGQNELVSGGKFRGVAARIEATYPLRLEKISDSLVLYLFGRVNTALGASHQTTPLLLQTATGVTATDPAVAIIAQPSNRDLYTIGVGVDAAALITAMLKKK